MVVEQEQILDVIRRTGPLLPAQLAKAIGTNILIASAHLSYLVDNKKVLISNTKVGGSPVYYIQGQQGRLQEFASNLHDKDQKTFNLLKERKVLRDDKYDQLIRLSLRTIKDFAVPLQVTKGQEKILFWKWYMISNQEAEEQIKRILEVRPEQKTIDKESKSPPDLSKDAAKPIQNIRPADTTEIEKERKQLEEERKKLQKEREDLQKRLEEGKGNEKKQNEKIEQEKKKIEDEKKRMQKEITDMKKQMQTERQSMLQELEEKKKDVKKQEVKKEEEDVFYLQLSSYLKEKEIKIEGYKIIKKKSEIDFVLKVPSVMGDIEYYCKARAKKSINDSDLSAAVVQGQLKKLPTLFLTTGELTKKAKELLNTELNKGLLIKKI